MVGMGCRNSETPVTDQLVKTGLAVEGGGGSAVQCNAEFGGLLRQDKGEKQFEEEQKCYMLQNIQNIGSHKF